MHQTPTRPQILIISEDTTVKLLRPDCSAPRLFFDRAQAEQALRADWPGSKIKQVGGKIMHMRVTESMAQVRDLFASAIEGCQDVGALDLAVVVTHTTTVEDTLLVSVLGAFLP